MSSKNTGGLSCDDEYNAIVVLPKLTKDEILSWKKKNKSQNTGTPILIDINNIKRETQEPVRINEEQTETQEPVRINEEQTETQEPVRINEEQTETLAYNCSVCDKNYTNWEKLILHKYFKHKNNLPYKCGICDEAFVLDGHLNQHLLKHVDYQCTIKPVAVQSPPKNNFSNGIPIKFKPFKCTNCVYGTKSEEKFSYHLTVCNVAPEDINDNEPNVCRLCFKKFLFKTKLKKHMRYHKFMSKLNLQVNNHRRIVNNTPPNQTNLPCNQQPLKKSFRIKFATTKNITQNRSIEFKCAYCKTSCKSERARMEHIKSHHPNQRRAGNNCLKLPTAKCQWCDMMITKRNLLRHIKSQHPQVKPFKCTHCSMNFKYLSSQKAHILQYHTTNKK